MNKEIYRFLGLLGYIFLGSLIYLGLRFIGNTAILEALYVLYIVFIPIFLYWDKFDEVPLANEEAIKPEPEFSIFSTYTLTMNELREM